MMQEVKLAYASSVKKEKLQGKAKLILEQQRASIRLVSQIPEMAPLLNFQVKVKATTTMTWLII